jgi:effector-binding domain-containing protein
MQIKRARDMWVLRLERTLRIPEIGQAAAELAPLIDGQIGAAKLQVDGPWVFISHGLPKDSETPFNWAICRPVIKPDRYDGAIELRHLPSITVASADYEGGLGSLFTKGYAPLLAEIEAAGHALSGESREIYHDWSAQGGAPHRIEIQFGLS